MSPEPGARSPEPGARSPESGRPEGGAFRRLTPHESGVRMLHVSDLHFGKPSVPEQVEALEAVIRRDTFSAIVLSGDLSQRTRTLEFLRAKEFVRLCNSRAPTLVIPGNHDTAWWMAPLGIGSLDAMFTRYRRHIGEDLEPGDRFGQALATGDWNGDGQFGTSDLVTAFQDGGYDQGPRTASQAVPEPSSGLQSDWTGRPGGLQVVRKAKCAARHGRLCVTAPID